MTLITSLVTVLLLAPQTPPPQTASPSPAPASSQYTLGPQDQIKLTVLEDSDLTGVYRVDADGYITMPYLNRVLAAGLTPSALQDRIRQLLKEGQFIRDSTARVDVEQAKSQSVIVSGEVRAPNEIPMSGNMTLLKALALAGSPTSAASSELTIAHRPKPGAAPTDKDPEPLRVNWKDIQIGKTQDVPLQDGDLVNVPKAQIFYIDGQVKNTGAFVWEPNLTVQQAIILAGGLTERGSDRGIKVTRLVKGKLDDVGVKLEDKVLPNDILHIKPRIF